MTTQSDTPMTEGRMTREQIEHLCERLYYFAIESTSFKDGAHYEGVKASWRKQVNALRDLALSALRASPREAVQWLDQPSHTGYWWVKDTADAAPRLVMAQWSKDRGAAELWECPGIGRTYVDHTGEARYQQVQPAIRESGVQQREDAKPTLICPLCEADRYEEPCRGSDIVKCPMVGTAAQQEKQS